MSEEPIIDGEKDRTAFSREVAAKEARKLKALRTSTPGVWSGLGMMGLIGWSVVVPTLLGAAIGIWLDNHQPGRQSWTLMLLIVGLILGCFNAWQWVAREEKSMRDEQEDHHEQ